MKKRCYIAGAGEFNDKVLPVENDYIIAADAGYISLTRHGIIPDLIVGDFDSLKKVPNHPNIIRSPIEKDDTDMMLAVKEGIKLGFTEFIINGGLGGRLDQTYANFQILTYLAEKQARGTLVGEDVYVTAIKDGEIEIEPGFAENKIISVFSAGGTATGVTLKGLKYPLDNATLTSDNPIGTSNEFTNETAVISVDSGTLIIIWNTD